MSIFQMTKKATFLQTIITFDIVTQCEENRISGRHELKLSEIYVMLAENRKANV